MTKRIRDESVCFLNYDLSFGGTEKVIVSLANHLSSLGRPVTIITLSSNNDEILVSIFFGSQQDKIWHFNGYRLETMVFDSAHSNYKLDSVELSTDFDCQGCTAFICLTEIDTDGSEDSTQTALEQLLNTIGYKALDTKSIVAAALPDNDFLGVIKLPYFVPEMGTEYRIEGKDLLDSYAYDIKISIKSK